MELDFIYRTRGSDELAPARHKGVMAHGRLGRLLEYEFGGFTGDGDNARGLGLRQHIPCFGFRDHVGA